MSFLGSVEETVAADRVPSTNETRTLVAPVDDVEGCHDRAARVDDHPGAEALTLPR